MLDASINPYAYKQALRQKVMAGHGLTREEQLAQRALRRATMEARPIRTGADLLEAINREIESEFK